MSAYTWTDIRTLYIQFLLSFLDSPAQTKSAFLEQRRDAFLAIFKGLFQDHYAVVKYVLETIWEGLLEDPKIKRTTKVNLFNEQTISHVSFNDPSLTSCPELSTAL
jgi:nucleolar pre-ribosomal-associated protein 1